MKVRELIPALMDRVSHFVVYDEATNDILYDSEKYTSLILKVGDATIRFVRFREYEGSFDHTTETACLIAAYYHRTQVEKWEE